MNDYTYSFSIADWLKDQIEDGCIEVPEGKEEQLAYLLYQNFDFSGIWDQLDTLAVEYASHLS